jgi:hypothetical protein
MTSKWHSEGYLDGFNEIIEQRLAERGFPKTMTFLRIEQEGRIRRVVGNVYEDDEVVFTIKGLTVAQIHPDTPPDEEWNTVVEQTIDCVYFQLQKARRK